MSMKNSVFVLMACGALVAQPTWAQTGQKTLVAHPVQMVSCAHLPQDMAFDIKPMGHEPGFEIYYLVVGEDLAAVKEDSLKLDFIKTKNGADIARSRTGKPAYSQGAFPKVSEDGKYAVFSVKVSQEQFGKVESLAIKGSVILLVASKREDKSAEIPLTDKKSKQLGPFTVAPQGAKTAMMGMLMGGNDLGIKITGPLESIINVRLVAGGQEEESNGNMSDGTSKTFFFNKPTTSSVTVRINYWADLREQKAEFGQ